MPSDFGMPLPDPPWDLEVGCLNCGHPVALVEIPDENALDDIAMSFMPSEEGCSECGSYSRRMMLLARDRA